jgi:radical SAM superfamily enzyme YgiQ (UPF0313 family)
MQKLMRKNLKFEQCKESIRMLVNRRILTHAFFLVGFPTETEEEVQATIDFSREIEAHTASFFIVNPFKGTELADMVEAAGKEATGDYLVKGYFDPTVADLGISEVPPARLREMVGKATRDFYLKHPERIYRILRDLPTKSQLPFLLMLWMNRAFVPGAIRFERAMSRAYGSVLSKFSRDDWTPKMRKGVERPVAVVRA